ncbi:MAG TPA: SDR family oxidoreductase [Pelomicrobium sp.]|nr:SDR family oxidoreductase [Pelomicrobium sp.]
MKLEGKRILITGAGSGIGRETALALARRGARLALLGRNLERLDAVAREIADHGGEAHVLVFDVAEPHGQERPVAEAMERLGGLDVLINNAGVAGYGDFAERPAEEIRRIVATNVTGPLLLTRVALRAVAGQPFMVVNVGSILGSLGMPQFATYSASKHALRGFSEALRRELADRNGKVCYVAPRTTRTAINADAVYRVAEKTGTATDSAADVARQIVAAMEAERAETYLGWPEKLFVRLNAWLPRLVDGGLKKQSRVARELARSDA